MPCIHRIDSIKIFMYKRDHNPPHFHAIVAEFEELILIEDLSTYSGEIPRAQKKKVINWAKENQEYMLLIWNKLRNTRNEDD